MPPEPKPRADRLCVVCEKPLPPSAGTYGAIDAFCQSRCCRTYFGTNLTVDNPGVKTVLAQRIEKNKTREFAR